MNMTRTTSSKLAEKLGISAPSMHYLLYWGTPEKEAKRTEHWSIDTLIALSKVIGMDFADFISFVYRAEKGREISVSQLLSRLPPRSKVRLECIAREASLYDAEREEEGGISRDNLFDMGELAWRCPGLVRDYIEGTLTDEDACLIFSEVDPLLVATTDPYEAVAEGYRKFLQKRA